MWKRITFKNRTWTKRTFSLKFVGRKRNFIVVAVVGKLFGGCHGENEDEDQDYRVRMFKSLLPLIDQGEIDVSQSGNGLVIRSQPTKSGGAVIPALRCLLGSDKKRIRSSFRTKQPIQSNTFVGGSV